MKYSEIHLLLRGILGTLLAISAVSRAESVLPQTDNAAPPYMGIYMGVPKAGAIEQVNEYATWLNRKLIWGHGSQGWDGWHCVERSDWLLKPWSDWVNAMPGRRFVISVPMLPTSPKDGPAITLKEGATGAYNQHFVAFGNQLVKFHLENSVIRLGWEFDGGWYPWAVRDRTDAENFRQCFRQVVTTMHAIPGLEKLEFCWNGAGEGLRYPLEAAYPGDDAVAYVGLDIYDKTWAKDKAGKEVYPCPAELKPEECLERHKLAWNALYGGNHGIAAWIAFAKSHNKPVFIPEWGLWSEKNHGGGDDPYFVEKMFQLIHDPANHIYEAAYWDSREAKVVPSGGSASQYPRSAEVMRKLFSLPQPEGTGAAKASSPATQPGAK
jgi:hypothetical protein